MSVVAFDEQRLRSLAMRHGTPLHVLDLSVVRERIARLFAAGTGRGFDRVRYAQKANPSLALLGHLRAAGVALDAVSAGELERARRAGHSPEDVSFCSDLFERDTLELLREYPAGVTIGSADMLEALAALRPNARVTLRVNPGVGRGHHAKVTTGGAHSKHGIWHADVPDAVQRARDLGLEVEGLHVHVGSGADPTPEPELLSLLAGLARTVGPSLSVLSAGGGLPVAYHPEDPGFDLDLLADTWNELREGLEVELGRELQLEVEPGRYVVAEAGLLVCEVRGRKRSPAADFVLVDAGFTELLRPAFYGAHHRIEVLGREAEPRAPRLVAGPLCESGDVFTVDAEGRPAARDLPDARHGDLVVIHDTGAYGSAMSSTYNSRPLAAEVLLDGERELLTRARQSIAQLLAPERS